MAWALTKGLTTVRAEFTMTWPGRDKTSDGSVGDLAHQDGRSGHNPDRTGNAEYKDGDALDEVRAIDVDRDLAPGALLDWMEIVVQYLIKRGRAGHYLPFRYIIYKSRIWNRSDGWQTHAYTGANRHDKHAHLSGEYTQTADNWTGSLGLASLVEEEGEMFAKFGDSGDKVTYLQRRLANLGFSVGVVDGDYREKTRAALAAAVKSYNGSINDGREYGPSEMIYLDVMWARKYGATPGPQGPAGPTGLVGPTGPQGPAGPPGSLSGALTGTLTVTGVNLEVVAEEG